MEKQRRNTKSKQLVMSLLSDSSEALCHDDIERQLSGQMDRVTIYRILQGFCDDGKVHKITTDGGKTYYALCHCCSAGNHHDEHLHFRCLQCNSITCLNEALVIPALPRGYVVNFVSCVISGLCPKCKKKQKSNTKIEK